MMKAWYKEGVVYQIYPRSFKDSNDDGIGDIPGIIEKLDYIKDLGIDIIWLSPVYTSPNFDNGYDISDYRNINPEFGTLEDWKTLIFEMHRRGLKLVMDLVVNHTSHLHQWFLESQKSKDNPYRDYYIWRKGNGKRPPNNWSSFFSGNAWEYDQTTDEYYLHLFSKEQPDLNWENPQVRQEVEAILRFWLDLGVDGFRCDVINLISKVDNLPNGKWKIALVGSEHYLNGPKVHEYLHTLNQNVLRHYDCFTVGEAVFTSIDEAVRYVKEDREELNMIFSFDHMNVDNIFKWFILPFKLKKLKKVFTTWQNKLDGVGWNSLYLENHDQPRIVSRWGNDHEYREKSAKMLATMMYFQQGTPYIYQGQEIGMTNANMEDLSQYKDIESQNIYEIGRHTLHLSHKRMMKKLKLMSRDNARTPIQWDDSTHAGFSNSTPWMDVNSNYQSINIKENLSRKDSLYHYYKELIQLRKKHEIIVYGNYQEFDPQNKSLYIYTREYHNEHLFVVANFVNKFITYSLPQSLQNLQGELLLSNDEPKPLENKLLLSPFEARVYLIK